MRNNNKGSLALLSLLLIALPCAAQTASNSEFEQFDQNRDQQLSASEFIAAKYSIEDFKSADSDQNQNVSVAEFAAFKTALASGQHRRKSGPHPPRG